MQNLVLAVQNTVDVRDIGAASAAVSFFRSLGGAVGVSALGAILASLVQNQVHDGLVALGPAVTAGGGFRRVWHARPEERGPGDRRDRAHRVRRRDRPDLPRPAVVAVVALVAVSFHPRGAAAHDGRPRAPGELAAEQA